MKSKRPPSQAELAARLAAIVQSSDDAIVGTTLDGIVTAWNPAAERIFGFSDAEAVGRPITLIVPEDRRAEEADVMARLRRGETVEHFETVRRAKDGRAVDVLLTVSPIRDAAGRVVGASTIARDVGERRLAARALERSETQARTILEAASEGIVIVDEAGAIVAVNRKTEEMFGYPRAELVGRPLELLLPERLQSRHVTHRAHYVRDPRARPMGRGLDLLARRRDGSEFPVEISLSHVQTAEGLRAMAFVTDITERKAIERVSRQAERLAAVGRLAAGVVHEVNNPLGIMTSRIELMLMDAEANGLPAETIEDLRVIHRNALRVADIAKSLLSLSREGPQERRAVDLNQVVRNVLLLVNNDFGRPSLRIVPELAPALPPLLGHGNALEQVLLNLLTNAAEAMPEGGEIRITTGAAGGRLHLTVADTGRGIPAGDLSRVFDPFFTPKATGTGLGLSVSYGIVQDHGGTIDVESTPGRGTRFVLTFPQPAARMPV
jgi:PAS domain S-box-containing protein